MGNSLELVLGSKSPRRKELFAHFNIPFGLANANIDEVSTKKNPEEIVLDIAKQKNSELRKQLKDEVIITADTIVVSPVLKVLGKPKDIEENRRFLLELEGKTHQVMSAVSISAYLGNKEVSHIFVEKTLVHFSSFNQLSLEQYLVSGDGLDKAGGYGIQGRAIEFVRAIEGCYSNVVGFPINRFGKEAQTFFSKEFSCKTWQELFLS